MPLFTRKSKNRAWMAALGTKLVDGVSYMINRVSNTNVLLLGDQVIETARWLARKDGLVRSARKWIAEIEKMFFESFLKPYQSIPAPMRVMFSIMFFVFVNVSCPWLLWYVFLPSGRKVLDEWLGFIQDGQYKQASVRLLKIIVTLSQFADISFAPFVDAAVKEVWISGVLTAIFSVTIPGSVIQQALYHGLNAVDQSEMPKQVEEKFISVLSQEEQDALKNAQKIQLQSQKIHQKQQQKLKQVRQDNPAPKQEKPSGGFLSFFSNAAEWLQRNTF
jgi:hypothetical protein